MVSRTPRGLAFPTPVIGSTARFEAIARAVDAGDLTRVDLDRYPHEVLKEEGDRAPRVVRYSLPSADVVLKEWAPTGRLMRSWSWLMQRREIINYRHLRGTPGIPYFVGSFSDRAFLAEYVPSRPMKRSLPKPLLHQALESLDRRLAALHDLGFVHLDLHQKRNVLVDEHGEAWIVDLGQGLHATLGPCRWLRRMLLPLTRHIDRRALAKFRVRYAPETLEPAERDKHLRRYGQRRKSCERWGRRLRNAIVAALTGSPNARTSERSQRDAP